MGAFGSLLQMFAGRQGLLPGRDGGLRPHLAKLDERPVAGHGRCNSGPALSTQPASVDYVGVTASQPFLVA
jgi:hypothetical protein